VRTIRCGRSGTNPDYFDQLYRILQVGEPVWEDLGVSTTPAIDAVLAHPRPSFTLDEAVSIAAATFEIDAIGARSLGSERDQAFALLGAHGAPLAVMKVSNAAEDPDTLDMEALVVDHIARSDPSLPVAAPRRVPGSTRGDDPASRRARFDGPASSHWVRMYDFVQGDARRDPLTLPDRTVVAWGEASARLARGMRAFIHPKAIREMPWDVQHAGRIRPMLDAIGEPAWRDSVTRTLDAFERTVRPHWSQLRTQVIHSDLTLDNALVDGDGLIAAIVDFGDMSYSALVADIAATVDSLTTGRVGDELFRIARLALDGYQRITPLEPLELDVLGTVWATRAAITIAIGAWRAAEGLEDRAFAERYSPTCFATLAHLLDVGLDDLGAALGGPRARSRAGDLIARRHVALGPAMEALSYDEPIHMASASGVWMIDVDGRRYLDMYNNVPSIGHSHPRVTEAIARQARILNTNMRYLHDAAIELAERLIATCPPSLDTVLFVNSGSEANDLAWRQATHHTGHEGGLCTWFAYHGISDAIAPMSPETLPHGHQAEAIERWHPTDTLRGLHADPASIATAIDRLAARGVVPAAAILDGVLQSDGVYALDPALVREWVRLVRATGGLWIADEVQGGHGRTGAMWSFERFGIEPDLVTLGKPMGNGHPVAAVITRREIAERFGRDTVFFSTFGGNPVSAAAALAVLDVLDDERVLDRVASAGEVLRQATRAATADDDRVGDVRGVGLANGIEIVTDRASLTPDAATAAAVRNGLRARGVLVGTTGPNRNVLKVRPPLAFTTDEVPVFVDALVATLASVGP
jgi:4-aminobutyrate aminotransferase-like enzyme/Ser/Thr protein kinase RdoA (MazF antagonist)